MSEGNYTEKSRDFEKCGRKFNLARKELKDFIGCF